MITDIHCLRPFTYRELQLAMRPKKKTSPPPDAVYRTGKKKARVTTLISELRGVASDCDEKNNAELVDLLLHAAEKLVEYRKKLEIV